MSEPTPAETILTNSTGPRSASGDSGSASAHSIPDQIAAVKFAAISAASVNPMSMIRRVKFAPRNPSGVNTGDYHG